MDESGDGKAERVGADLHLLIPVNSEGRGTGGICSVVIFVLPAENLTFFIVVVALRSE